MTGGQWALEKKPGRNRPENGSRQAGGHEKSLLNGGKCKDSHACPRDDRDTGSALGNSVHVSFKTLEGGARMGGVSVCVCGGNGKMCTHTIP